MQKEPTMAEEAGRPRSSGREVITLALLLVLATPTVAEPIEPGDVYVIDGDTINVFHVQPNVRLVGFNAPESLNKLSSKGSTRRK